jgi:outer membrane immunogenic protein
MRHRWSSALRRRLLSSVAATALMGGTALAQTPASPWQGPYIGANLGYYGTDLDAIDINGPISGPPPSYEYYHSVHGGGVLGGGQLGYNWQMSQFVLGVEGDIDFGSESATNSAFGGGLLFHSAIPVLGTVRGRLGYAFAMTPLMIYATGGLAVGRVTDRVSEPFGTPSWNSSGTRTGWTAGGGLEYAFARNWTVKVEALYVDLGNAHAVFQSVIPYRFDFKDSAVIGRAGINFHF